MRRIVILVLVIAAGLFRVQAQTYPVQATTQLMPPYSLYLADYVSAGSERLALNVYLADIARPTLDVRFRLRIVGQGITLETKAEYIPAPISLQGGVPLRLISTDLAEYFNPNNLNFQGMSRQEYNRAGKLPEGAYQFCFEVLEYNRGVKISNTACAMAWLILNDPPMINLPANGAKLKAQDPQNVLLQWTPRHTGSPNSAFNTEYDVRMVEVWPATRNPNDAILSSPPIFETTTANTTVIYGPAETPLEPGRRYAFRVRARSMVGLDEIDLFKNRGYSEVFTFVYGDPCDLPTGITAASISPTRFSLSWQTMFSHTAYRVRYREVGTTHWYENNVTLNSSEITGLKPGTRYEYQVAANCGFYSGQYSEIARVTTAETPEAEYACGVPLETFKLDPAALAGSLKVGDIIQAGDFDVKLTKVSGGNGVFTGEGIIEVPYFNKAKVNTKFSSITVSKELRMVNGYLNVTGAAVDVIPEGVTKFIDDLNEALDLADSALDKIEETLPEQFDPHSFVPDTLIVVKDGVQAVYPNPDGSVSIVDKEGEVKTLPPGTTAAIVDDTGKGYLVDAKGKVHPVSSEVALAAGNRELNLMLTFARQANTKYGYDVRPSDALGKDYEVLKGGYAVAWKSVAVGEQDPVKAILAGSAIDKNKIRFEMGGAPVTASPGDGQSLSVMIPGVGEGIEQGLLALYTPSDTAKDQVLGKLNVVTYGKISKEVVIVPVNGATLPAGLTDRIIQDSLNAIYGQAVVDWKVSVAQGITASVPASFDDGESGVLSNYTSDMKKVIKAYGQLQDEKYYLFLIETPKSGRGLGYMPRGKSAGFIFMAPHAGSRDAVVRTMAHELGHGAFNLQHIFQEPHYQVAEGSTDNLMDYPAGRRLYKFQWDKIRFPDIVVGLFEEDEDAELAALVVEFSPEPEATTTQECYSSSYFMAPSGEVFSVSANNFQSVGIAKAGGPRQKYFVDLIRDKNGAPYLATNDAEGKFLGYYAGDSKLEVKYIDTGGKPVKVKVLSDYGDQCFFKYQCIAEWIVPKDQPVEEVVNLVEQFVGGDPGMAWPWAGRTSESPECQSILYLMDATVNALPGDVYAELKSLFDGDHNNRLTGAQIRLKGKLVLTSSDPKLNKKTVTVKTVDGKDVLFFDGKPVDVPADEVLFWLEANGTQIKIKRIIFGEYLDGRMRDGIAAWETGVTWDQKSFWEKSAAIGYMAIDGYFTALYDLTDLLASGIEHLKLPPSVYDCNAKEYNGFYAKAFGMLNITTVFQNVVFNKLKEYIPDLETKIGGNPEQIQFAMFCGMYNGLIGVVKSVPEFVHMVLTPLTEKGRESLSTQWGQFAELEIKQLNEDGSVRSITCKKDEYFCKAWELVSTGVVKMFTEGGGCAVAANVGELVGPIIVMCFGDAAAAEGVVAKVGGTVIRVLKWCDDFADVFRQMRLATSMIKTAGGKLLLRISDGTGDVMEQLASGMYRVRVILENNSPLDLILPQESLETVLAAIPLNGRAIDMRHVDGFPDQPFHLFSRTADGWSKAGQQIAESLGMTFETLKSFRDHGLTDNAIRNISDKLEKMGKKGEFGHLLAFLDQVPASIKDNAAAMRAMMQDITDNPSVYEMVKNKTFDATIWNDLRENGSRYVRRSADDMARFAQLSQHVRKYVAMFSDDAAKTPTTLQTFLKAIDDDVNFRNFVNDPANERFVKGFVSHKADISKTEGINIGELLAEVRHANENGPGVWPDKVAEWLERSEGFTNFNRYSGLGTSLSNKIAASLRGQSGELYNALKTKLNLPNVNGKSLLDQYELFTEVPLKTKGGFMKADIMLIKRNPNTNQIEDVIILENKLSKTTDYTPRQKEGFKEIGSREVTEMHLEYKMEGMEEMSLNIRKDRCFRVSDHGTDDISRMGGSDIVGVDYSKFD